MAKLFIVATPIGNLEDITLRALRILKEVALVLCEDTRTTAKLLQTYGIKTPTMSYHAHSTVAKAEKIFAFLEEGKDIALVSDAGTPCISDPGVLLVAHVRARFGDAVSVVPVPGPSAVVAALSASGVPASEFLFLGFLPHKKGRETLFREIAASERAVVFYESRHRILKTLVSLDAHLEGGRKITVAKELTKIHERFLSGMPSEVLAVLKKTPGLEKGEFVVIVHPS